MIVNDGVRTYAGYGGGTSLTYAAPAQRPITYSAPAVASYSAPTVASYSAPTVAYVAPEQSYAVAAVPEERGRPITYSQPSKDYVEKGPNFPLHFATVGNKRATKTYTTVETASVPVVPTTTYAASPQVYDAVSATTSGIPQTFSTPARYTMPAEVYEAPLPTFSAPAFEAPVALSAPARNFAAQTFAAPTVSYSEPYAAPAVSYSAPTKYNTYAAPASTSSMVGGRTWGGYANPTLPTIGY